MHISSNNSRVVVSQPRTFSSVAVTESATDESTSNANQNQKKKRKEDGTTTTTKSRLSKCLTREMLRTRKLWLPLDEQFAEIKEALQEDFQITYGAHATTLRCRLEQQSSSSSSSSDGDDEAAKQQPQQPSLATYLQIVCSTADTALIQESAKEARDKNNKNDSGAKDKKEEPKGTIKIDRSEDDELVKIEYRPPGMDHEKDNNNNDTTTATNTDDGHQPRVLGITFQVRLGQIGPHGAPLDSALLVDCGMDVCDSEIHILHVEYECGSSGGGSGDNNNKTTTSSDTLDSRKIAVSHKFRYSTETYGAIQKYLSLHCGIDENVAKFLMNYNIFRRQQNKLKFLQGVKTLLE